VTNLCGRRDGAAYPHNPLVVVRIRSIKGSMIRFGARVIRMRLLL
jgi:hypothetical protein